METEPMSSTILSPSSGCQQLEQFVILAKSAKGSSLNALVLQAVEANDVYFFGELLALPCIKNMNSSETTRSHFNLLNLFAFGNYKEYLLNAENLPQLTPTMKKKLRYLTLASLATDLKLIPYSTLLKELSIESVRELEDLLIAAIYADVINGKLDQQNARLEVDWAIGRDLKQNDMEFIVGTLTKWELACNTTEQTIRNEVSSANKLMNEERIKKEQIETEISNIKKTIRTTLSQQDMDLSSSGTGSLYSSPSTNSNTEIKTKKSKIKGLRGSGKLWSKN